jgi:dienelactone hydrolase
VHRSPLAAASSTLLAALLLAACGDGDEEAVDATTTSATTVEAPDAGALYELPEPTGPHTVGVRSVGEVVVRYPAEPADGDHAPALDAATVEETARGAGVAPERLEAVRSHAVADAPAADADEPRPVVVLSAGFGLPMALYTGLADELASHGYVVAAVEHDDPVEPSPDIATLRADELRAVVDALEDDGVDVDRVAVVGHSIGGAAAAELLVGDERFDAGLNLDGSVIGPTAQAGIDRPFLVVLSGGRPLDSDPSLAPFRDRTTPLEGTGHLSFSDVPFVVEALPELAAQFDVGTLDAAATHRAVSDLVLAFLAEHLAGGG